MINFYKHPLSFCIDTKLIHIWISDPMKTWRKARKYFKHPKIKVHFFRNIQYNCPYANYNWVGRFIDIQCTDVGWKDKWNSPRHERDPYIWVCFLRRFGFSINYKIWFTHNGEKRDGGMFYWEYLLDYVFYDKNLDKVTVWKTSDDKVIPTKEFSLKHYEKSI